MARTNQTIYIEEILKPCILIIMFEMEVSRTAESGLWVSNYSENVRFAVKNIYLVARCGNIQEQLTGFNTSHALAPKLVTLTSWPLTFFFSN